MVLFNYSTRELTAKVVYYGPGLCGKTTNLQYIHTSLPDNVKGRMLSLATKTDRTLFFDFLPLDLGDIRGMKTRVQLYTVPGQVFYNETRRLVLKGADGIVFVADSQEQMMGANIESFRNLEENLRGHGMKLADMPHVIQFNKRDLPNLASIEDLNAGINKYNAPFYESVATTGIGVQDTLKAIVKLVLLHLTRKYEAKGASAAAERVAAEREPVSAPSRTPVDGARPFEPPRRSPIADPQPSQEPRESIPLSAPAEPAARRPSPLPPPPDFRGVEIAAAAARGSSLAFGEEEIDHLVEEVEEAEALLPAAESLPWLAMDRERPLVAPEQAPSYARIEVEALPPAEAPALTDERDEGDFSFSEPYETALPPASAGAPGAIEELVFATEPPAAQKWSEPLPAESEFEVDVGFDPMAGGRRTRGRHGLRERGDFDEC